MAGAGNQQLGAGDLSLEFASERVDAVQAAGDTYTEDLETIRDNLDADDESGTTLGTMVSSQLKLTESETAYQVRSGIPNKVSKAVKGAADEVKRAAG